jgi:pyruvate dehydrogenase E2 component (dihydrolipoamide acetyltransferase)
MPHEIRLPELAESVVEGEIQRWLVAVGDRVAVDQPLVEVMTDKATVELPSPFAGIVHRLLVREGEVVPVHGLIAIVLAPGESEPTEAAPAKPAPEPSDGSLFRPSADAAPIRNPFLVAKRIRVTPAARKIARDRGVDLASVAGSGPHGRIRVQDVEAAGRRSAKASGGLASIPYRSTPELHALERRVPIRGVRRAIVEQMTASHLHPVRTLVVDEADFTRLKALRARWNRQGTGARLTYLPFICHAVARGLERFPALNSSIDEVSEEIVFKSYCHLGLAVATDAGLVVPVVRDAGTKSLGILADEIEDLAARARHGKLSPVELVGSSFTITSIGPVGTLFSFPIINLPNAAILGVHTIQRRPVVIEEAGEERIVARDMVYLSLSFDHRLIDGATAADFMQLVVSELEGDRWEAEVDR